MTWKLKHKPTGETLGEFDNHAAALICLRFAEKISPGEYRIIPCECES